MMLTLAQRKGKARRIVEAMQVAYEEEGIEGDFDDAERYLSDDVSDAELLAEEVKWCGLGPEK